MADLIDRKSIDELYEKTQKLKANRPVERIDIDELLDSARKGRHMSHSVLMNRVINYTEQTLGMLACCYKNREALVNRLTVSLLGQAPDGTDNTDVKTYGQILKTMAERGRFGLEKSLNKPYENQKDNKPDKSKPQPPIDLLFTLSILGWVSKKALLDHCNNVDPDYVKVNGDDRPSVLALDEPHMERTMPEDERTKSIYETVVKPFLDIPTADYIDCLKKLEEEHIEDFMQRKFAGIHVLYFRAEEEAWRKRYGRARTVADALIDAMDWLYFAQGNMDSILVRELVPADENKAYYKTKCSAETVWALLVTGPIRILQCVDKFL